jgi:hypothetical protein
MLVANERTKLLANALDRASTSCFTVGIATPLAGWLYNVGGFRGNVGSVDIIVAFLGWSVAAAVLHLIARRVLGGLKT